MLPSLLLALALPVPQAQPLPPQLRCSQKVEKSFLASTGDTEFYWMYRPILSSTFPQPLIVIFHSTYGDHTTPTKQNLWDDWDLIHKANCQGWYVAVHDGGFIGSPDPSCPPATAAPTYGSERFMAHTREALTHMLASFNVNPNRIYGVGFSSGGGEALAYAARNLDPAAADEMTGASLAAVIAHSSYISSSYEFFQDPNFPGLVVSCNLNGASGFDYCSDPFLWQRASVLVPSDAWIDFSTCTESPPWPSSPWMTPNQAVQENRSQIRNIATLPMRSTYTPNEHFPIIDEALLLENWLDLHYGGLTTHGVNDHQVVPNCSIACPMPNTTECSPKHQWDTLCADHVLNFFAGKTIGQYWALTNGGQLNRTLFADGDRKFHFEVTPALAGEFVVFDWGVVGADHLTILDPGSPTNLGTIRIRADDAYSVLDTGNTVTLDTDTPFQCVVTDYASDLTDLKRDGISQSPGFWSWNPIDEEISFPVDGGAHTWELVP